MTHGAVLDMEVDATIFARTELPHLGIAPLTSMFLFDATDRTRFSDFRPNVHDSDGLLIHNGAGEIIWRPLANPATLEVSAFGDTNPKGFGLMQRKRAFDDYNDLEALYHKRPSVWITPRGDWGAGAVTLVEIPTDLEIYDNIVAYWRPAAPLAAGGTQRLRYNLQWGADPAPRRPQVLRVLHTAMGGRPEGGLVMVIDFSDGPSLPANLDEIDVVLRSSHGTTTPGIVDQLRQGIGKTTRTDIMNGQDRTILSQRDATIDHLLTTTLHLRVAALYRGEIQLAVPGATGNR